PLVNSGAPYLPTNCPLSESSRQPSSTFSSHPSYLTTTTSSFACAWKLDWSVASHSTMNGRSWFFGLHLFWPANVLLISVLCPESPPGGLAPHAAKRETPATIAATEMARRVKASRMAADSTGKNSAIYPGIDVRRRERER